MTTHTIFKATFEETTVEVPDKCPVCARAFPENLIEWDWNDSECPWNPEIEAFVADGTGEQFFPFAFWCVCGQWNTESAK